MSIRISGPFLRGACARQPRPHPIKDVQPGTMIGLASYLADVYITGDKHVTLVSIEDVKAYVRVAMGEIASTMAMPSYPNYCLTFRPG